MGSSFALAASLARSEGLFKPSSAALYTELCEKARSDAYRLMREHANDVGANAIIGMRYDANEVTSGVTEVLCYGTAVQVEGKQDLPEVSEA